MNCDDLSSPYQNLEKPCSLQLHFVGFVVPASRLHRLEIILHQLYSTGDWLTNCFMLLVFGLYHYMLCTSFPWVFILIYLFTILRLLRVDLCCFILLEIWRPLSNLCSCWVQSYHFQFHTHKKWFVMFMEMSLRWNDIWSTDAHWIVFWHPNSGPHNWRLKIMTEVSVSPTVKIQIASCVFQLLSTFCTYILPRFVSI